MPQALCGSRPAERQALIVVRSWTWRPPIYFALSPDGRVVADEAAERGRVAHQLMMYAR